MMDTVASMSGYNYAYAKQLVLLLRQFLQENSQFPKVCDLKTLSVNRIGRNFILGYKG